MQGRSEDQRDLLDVESVAGHLLKPGSVFALLAEHRRELFPDELFADLFPSGRGRPSVPADVMATVIMLQALHGLSDSECHRRRVGGSQPMSSSASFRWSAALCCLARCRPLTGHSGPAVVTPLTHPYPTVASRRTGCG